jgi:hypothetical protein
VREGSYQRSLDQTGPARIVSKPQQNNREEEPVRIPWRNTTTHFSRTVTCRVWYQLTESREEAKKNRRRSLRMAHNVASCARAYRAEIARASGRRIFSATC